MNHLRHAGIFSLDNIYATLIGAGGIGAITGIVLAKMGIPYIRVIDDDKVDDVNLPTQFHQVSDVGKLKGMALNNNIHLFSDETLVDVVEARIQSDNDISYLQGNLIISAVDSITARKAIWEAVKEWKPDWYLDARMGAETFMLYKVDMNDYAWYEALLAQQNESDIADDPCTQKATMYTACIAAGHTGNVVKQIACNEFKPGIIVHDIKNQVLTVI